MPDMAIVLTNGELLHEYAGRVTRKLDEARVLLREVEWVYDDSGDYYCATRLAYPTSCLQRLVSYCDGYAQDVDDGVEDTPTGLQRINPRLIVKRPHASDCRIKLALEGS